MTQYKRLSSICYLGLALILKVNASDDILQCRFEPGYYPVSQIDLNWRRDKTKYISPYLLYQKTNKNFESNHVVIDIRTKLEYEKFHIKGSINLPYFSLKTRSIFKNYKVVLVGSGDDYKYIEKLYDGLINTGFKHVSILDGGINFWKNKIELTTIHEDEYRLNNIDKLINGDKTKWKIIDSSNNENITEIYPATIKLTDKKLIYKPNTQIKIIQNNLIENVLLVLTEEFNTNKILNLWQHKLKANIYIINDKKMSVAINQINNQKQSSYKKRLDGAQVSCL